ncbi:MFS transporter [Amycolatopsis anabasis]|uniref:MFS transporter n=1 Tax=Amycolatopsis anabasis TaxID=1840409 RepID=UPI00131C3D0C|nr:MFS transporter [Amycolatopsis anabasis]
MTTDTSLRAGRREWIGLAVLALPTLLISMDMTVLHLAVPYLSEDLKPGGSQLLWILDIYGFLIAGSLVTMGTLGDRIGRRKLLLIGAAAFGVASVLAAFAGNAETLIATRALLGIAGATLMPSTMALIRNMFTDPGQRTFAIGVWMTGFTVGMAIGPLVGGLLLENFWWGSVFLINAPVMVLLLVAGPFLLPEHRDPNAGRLDLASAVLSLATVLPVIYGLKDLAEHGAGWVPAVTIVAGLAVGVVFLRRQRTLADPMIDLKLLRNRSFNASLATQTLAIFAMGGAQFFVGQFLQLVLGLSPLEAGLWMLPSTVGAILGVNLAPVIVRYVRHAYLMGGGLALAALGLVLITQADGEIGLPIVVAGFTVISLGVGPAFTLTTDLIMATAPPERAGAASAITETGAEFGMAVGIAVLGSIGTAVYRGQAEGTLPAGIPPEAAEAARDTLGGAVAVGGQLPAPLGPDLLTAAREAFTSGMQVTVAVSAVIVAGVAVLAATLLRNIRPTGEPAPEPEPAVACETA